MVPWQQEERNSTRTQLGSLDMKSKQLTMNETDGPNRQGQVQQPAYLVLGGRLGAATVGTSFTGCSARPDNDVLGNYSGSLVSLFLVESIIFIICKELSSVPTGCFRHDSLPGICWVRSPTGYRHSWVWICIWIALPSSGAWGRRKEWWNSLVLRRI